VGPPVVLFFMLSDEKSHRLADLRLGLYRDRSDDIQDGAVRFFKVVALEFISISRRQKQPGFLCYRQVLSLQQFYIQDLSASKR